MNKVRHDNSKPRAYWTTAVSLFVLLLAGPAVGADSKDDKANDEDLIKLQIFNDMMEGADDYFGEYSDLSYADHVIPKANEPPPPPPPPPSPGGGHRDTTPTQPTPAVQPPPEEPPPEPPTEPPSDP